MRDFWYVQKRTERGRENRRNEEKCRIEINENYFNTQKSLNIKISPLILIGLET